MKMVSVVYLQQVLLLVNASIMSEIIIMVLIIIKINGFVYDYIMIKTIHRKRF